MVLFTPERYDSKSVAQEESQWFKGFDETYFLNRGTIIRRMMGKWAIIYCAYFVITKYRLYKSNIGMLQAYRLILKGMCRSI